MIYKSETLGAMVGSFGAEYISDTASHTGGWFAVTTIADTVFTTYTDGTLTGDLTGDTIPAGITIYGDISVIRLTSGIVMAYKKPSLKGYVRQV
jgi:hypothetical protein